MSLATLRFSRLYRLAAWLALWVMLFPAFLPLVHHQAALAGSAMPANCPMLAGGGDQPQPHQDQQKSKPACPICQSLAGMAHGYVPPVVAGLAVVTLHSHSLEISHQAFVIGENSTSSWPRAPPVLA